MPSPGAAGDQPKAADRKMLRGESHVCQPRWGSWRRGCSMLGWESQVMHGQPGLLVQRPATFNHGKTLPFSEPWFSKLEDLDGFQTFC